MMILIAIISLGGLNWLSSRISRAIGQPFRHSAARSVGALVGAALFSFVAGWMVAPQAASAATEAVVIAQPSESPAANTQPAANAVEEAPAIVVDDSPESVDTAIETQPRIVIHNSENRPSWIGTTPVRSGEIHRTAVRSGPYHLQRDSNRVLDDMLQKAVTEYVDEWLAVQDAHQLLPYDLGYVKTHLLQPIDPTSGKYQYDEVAEHPLPIGLMHESHALLAFDKEFRDDLEQRWERIVAAKRLLQTGLAAFGILGLLAVSFGYFKVDTATRGFYTGRLQFAAAAAILALVAAGALMAHWIPVM